MKKLLSQLVLTGLFSFTVMSVASASVELITTDQRVSYSLGVLLANQLAGDFEQIDQDAFNAGFTAAYLGKKTQINVTDASQEVQQYQQKRADAIAAENLAESEAFLVQVSQQDGIQSTLSGLQYKVIKAGSGNSPESTDKVTVHYRGTLMNGVEFDSSYSRGKPASFTLNGVIPGWTEGLQLMQEGAVYEFYIHPDLAYGTRGAGETIGANSALVFKVELLKVGD
jgi:FKBP-type peptidyl-prolyl cis-trans isomerase